MKEGEKSSSRAISPVVGVVLLVAIAVGLAAAVGGYVFVFQDDLGETAPSADIDYDVDQTDDEIEVRYGSGDVLEPGDQYAIQVNGDEVLDDEVLSGNFEGSTLDDEINDLNPVIGEIDVVDADSDDTEVEEGDELQLLWVDDDGEDTSEVGESFTVPTMDVTE